MRRQARLVPLAVALFAIVGACSGRSSTPRARRPAIEQTWQNALTSARRAADEGRYVDADRELAVFGSLYPDTPEAVESAYWRTLYKLDPRNSAASVRDAVSLVDTILLSEAPNSRRTEAIILRRTALLMDSLRKETEAPKTTVVIRDTARDVTRERAYEEQIKMLQDSLTNVLAELDRIRKRITTPRP